MKIGIETESLHLWFQNKKMDIFSFIEKANELGVDGIQINMIKDYNLDENWGTLGSCEKTHLLKVKQLLEKYNLYVELDIRNLDYERFEEVIPVAEFLGANLIRSYIPITINKDNVIKSAADGAYDIVKVKQDFDYKSLDHAVEKIKKILPLLEKSRIKLCLENHEYETSYELVEVIKKVNSPFVGLLYDFGNSMMAFEDPIVACKNMAPYVHMTHVKDHVIIEDKEDEFGYVVCGVPLGKGNIDIKGAIDILYKESDITRLNIEMCFPYCAEFKRSIGTGGVYHVGSGPFKIEKALYDLKPKQYYYPHEVSEEILNKLLSDQMNGLEESVKYLKEILKEY